MDAIIRRDTTYDDRGKLDFLFQTIPSTYEEITTKKKAHRLLVENLVDTISQLIIKNQTLTIQNINLKQENSILRTQTNHQRKIRWQRAGQ